MVTERVMNLMSLSLVAGMGIGTAAQYMLTGMEGLLIFTGSSTHHLLLTGATDSFETTGTKCKASV